MWCATMKTIPSVPVIVAAANRNGIVAASDRPNTARRTASAIGSAIDSPRARSWLKIGSRSAWIAVCPIPEVVLEDRPRALRVGARDRKRVGEERRQLRCCDAACQQD